MLYVSVFIPYCWTLLHSIGKSQFVFTYFPVDGPLGYFQSWVVMNKAALNILI